MFSNNSSSNSENAENYLNLNEAQRKAVKHLEGPLLILAGAGTGKTTVLTNRIAHLIKSKIALPSDILAVTFTNKAAKEMTERISKMVDSFGLTVGTFHSVAAKILRSQINALDIGITSNFTIIDAAEQLSLIKDIQKRLNIDSKLYPPKMVQSLISRWKDQSINYYQLTENDLKLPSQKIAKNIYQIYQTELISSNNVDFGDLLLYNNEIFIKNPSILNFYQQKYKYILIDEYQDTNVVQYLWARMLAMGHNNICCVGDDDQSIYSWRGAEIGNILRFEKDFPNATIIKLEENYRSSPQILKAASGLIKNNKERHNKTLRSNKDLGNKIQIISCWNEKEEARFVVGEISRLIKNNYSPNEIAILVRAGFQTRTFEEALISSALPYRIIGGLKFYERMEIRDSIAYIRVVINHNDSLALRRIINVPKRAVGEIALNQIINHANENNISLFSSIKILLQEGSFKTKLHENLQKFILQIERWQEYYKEKKITIAEVTKLILEESGYLSMIKEDKDLESRNRVENINEMIKAISEFDNIEEFIEHSSLIMENETLESNFGGAVSVMTLHAAKGLEFAAVFLPGWEEGLFPHQKSLDEGEKGLEEERRIAYVGLTRAKSLLYITFAESRRIFYEITRCQPSRFLAEIPEEVTIKTSSSSRLNSHSYVFPGSNKGSLKHNSNNNHAIDRNFSDSKDDSNGDFQPGKKVMHVKYGKGTILNQKGDNLEIIFEGNYSIKTIKKNFISIL